MISSSFFFPLDKCSLFLQVQGFCFGFIEFELLNSMHSAIEVWNLALATAFTVQCSFLFTIVFVNSCIKKQVFFNSYSVSFSVWWSRCSQVSKALNLWGAFGCTPDCDGFQYFYKTTCWVVFFFFFFWHWKFFCWFYDALDPIANLNTSKDHLLCQNVITAYVSILTAVILRVLFFTYSF